MTNPTEDTAGAPPSAPAKATPPIQGHRAIISARYLPLLGEFRAKTTPKAARGGQANANDFL